MTLRLAKDWCAADWISNARHTKDEGVSAAAAYMMYLISENTRLRADLDAQTRAMSEALRVYRTAMSTTRTDP